MAAAESSRVQSGIDGTIDVQFRGDVAIIHMNRGDNRVNEDFIEKMNQALDKIERNKDIRALITTGNGRFYNNGLDLAWMNYVTANEVNGANRVKLMLQARDDLRYRIATFPIPTVAALNGHTYASGGMLSMEHDYRVMRTGRGWWCLNEVITGVRFWRMPPILKLKLDPAVALEVSATGRRYPAEEALRQGIVDRVCPGDELIEQSIALAREVIDRGLPSRYNLHTMKCGIYGEMLKPVQSKI